VLRERIASALATRTRDEWADLAAGTDTCLAPVLSLHEVPDHPHHRHRGSFITVGDSVQPAPAPRFSRTVPSTPTPPPSIGSDAHGVLSEWGVGEDEIVRLEGTGAFHTPG
jgi:alpha-methylacyl-CoA racemase